MTLYTCPVLAFTPDIERWFDMFEGTHQPTLVGPGLVQFRREAMLAAGGWAEQPAKEWAAVEFIAQQRNALLRQARQQRPRERR